MNILTYQFLRRLWRTIVREKEDRIQDAKGRVELPRRNIQYTHTTDFKAKPLQEPLRSPTHLTQEYGWLKPWTPYCPYASSQNTGRRRYRWNQTNGAKTYFRTCFYISLSGNPRGYWMGWWSPIPVSQRDIPLVLLDHNLGRWQELNPTLMRHDFLRGWTASSYFLYFDGSTSAYRHAYLIHYRSVLVERFHSGI